MKLDNILQKSFLQLLFIITAIIPVLTSCNIEKRIYMPGANIEWKKWKQSSVKQELYFVEDKFPQGIKSAVPTYENAETYTVCSINIGNINNLRKQPDFKYKTEERCDTIFLKNGEQIKAKVLEVGQSEIKYKLCD